MPSWLRDRFANLRGAWGVIDAVNLSEIPEAYAASKRAVVLWRDCNLSADDEVGAAIDATLVAAKENADVTATQIDDEIVDSVAVAVRSNRSLIIEAIQWLAGHADDDVDTTVRLQAFAAARGYGAGEQSGNILVWIEVAALIWSLVKPFIRK